MNILFHQYFVTSQEPGVTQSYWNSKELVKRGHHITVITGNSGLNMVLFYFQRMTSEDLLHNNPLPEVKVIK